MLIISEKKLVFLYNLYESLKRNVLRIKKKKNWKEIPLNSEFFEQDETPDFDIVETIEDMTTKNLKILFDNSDDNTPRKAYIKEAIRRELLIREKFNTSKENLK